MIILQHQKLLQNKDAKNPFILLRIGAFKEDKLESAKTKLTEAEVVTGMSIDSFISSEPYKDKNLTKVLEQELKTIKEL